jgi:hypothetical protein
MSIIHDKCTNETECTGYGCKNNIWNMMVDCPLCGSRIDLWRLQFAIKNIDNAEILKDAADLWMQKGESMLHSLIHIPESY